MPIIRRSYCVPLPIVVRPVVAVVMLESRVASCVQCVENVYLLIKDARLFEHKVLKLGFAFCRTANGFKES